MQELNYLLNPVQTQPIIFIPFLLAIIMAFLFIIIEFYDQYVNSMRDPDPASYSPDGVDFRCTYKFIKYGVYDCDFTWEYKLEKMGLNPPKAPHCDSFLANKNEQSAYYCYVKANANYIEWECDELNGFNEYGNTLIEKYPSGTDAGYCAKKIGPGPEIHPMALPASIVGFFLTIIAFFFIFSKLE